MIPKLLLLAAAYILGGIPFGYLLVKFRTGEDVRAMGSGNIGATNVLRTSGRLTGIVTLLLDMLKGWVAVWLMARYTYDDPLWMSLAAAAVILGHGFSIFLKFQGGKAVASYVGAFMYLAPFPLLATLIVFVLSVWRTRYISFGSVLCAVLFPFAVWMIDHSPWPVILTTIGCGAFVIWRHSSNIERLVAGTENVFTFSKKMS